MAQNGKIIPNLDQERTKQINLTVLQRIDPFLEEILMTAGHVTLYEFNVDINQWSRKDVEGSLFVVKRNKQPRFQFIVMNRRSTENLVEDLLGDFEYEVQSPYLLYRNGAQEVNGIWFYNAQDCEAVANLFSRILNAFSKVPTKPVVSTVKSEFEELEAVPSLDVIEGPLEPQRPTSTSVPDASDGSFLNFFNTAMNTGNATNTSNAVQKHAPPANVPVTAHMQKAIEHPMPILQPTPSLPASSNPLLPLLDAHKTGISRNHATNLVNPSLFSMSSSLMMPPQQIQPSAPTVVMQQPYGTPLLQPFPPPTPPPSLTPISGPVITRDKVRDALVRLVQSDQFIDMVHRELLNAHNS